MQIISRKLAGILTITGLIAVLFLILFFNKSFVIALCLLLIILIFVGFLYRPDWGLIAFMFIRPMADKFSEDISLSITRNLSINISALLGLLFLFLSFVFILKNKIKVFSIPLARTWIIFIFISLISIFFSVNPPASFYEVVRISTIFSIFLLAYSIYQNNKNPELFLKIILASSIIPFVFAFYQLFTQTGLGGTSGIDSRLYGTFSHPNAFASFILIIFAISIFFIFKKDKNKKSIYYLTAIFSLFLILETFSRGAWIALLIFSLMISLFKSKKIIIFLSGVLVLLFFVSPVIRDRIEDVYNPPATSSIVWRFQQWEKIYSVFIKKPLTGYGSGAEKIVHENEFGFYAGNPYTHNDILKAALETGIFGALSFLALLVLTFILLFEKYWKSKTDFSKKLALIIMALFFAQIAFSMSSNIFRGTATQWALWALIGLVLVNKKIEK